MRRKLVTFTWEDEDAQKCFAEWCPFPDAAASAQDVDRIESFLRLSPPLDVLDVGCGTGRHAVEMARRGYRVVGIDVAQRYLTQAREAAQKAGRFILSEKRFREGYRDEYCVVIDTNTGDVTEYQEHQRAFGYGEIIDRLCKAGFKSVEAYRDFDGTPARAEEFSVFVCRK